MKDKKEILKGSFHFGKLCCRYYLLEEEGRIYLLGEEEEKGVLIWKETLVFSEEERVFAEGFYSLLVKSRTCPRMMSELAEEILP